MATKQGDSIKFVLECYDDSGELISRDTHEEFGYTRADANQLAYDIIEAGVAMNRARELSGTTNR